MCNTMSVLVLAAILSLGALTSAVHSANHHPAAPPPPPPGDVSRYAVTWDDLLPEPGNSSDGLPTYRNSMPVGNGHVAGNVLYERDIHAVTALISSSSAWGEGGDLLKVALLTVRLAGGWPAGRTIRQTLDPATATVHIELDLDGGEVQLRGGGGRAATPVSSASVSVYVDALRDVLVVNASSGAVIGVTLSSVRPNATASDPAENYECRSYVTSADVASKDGLAVYHQNVYDDADATYMRRTLVGENIPLDGIEGFDDPFSGRSTGAATVALALAPPPSSADLISVAVITQERTASGAAFESYLRSAASAAASETGPASRVAHEAWWAARWDKHYIHIPSQPTLSRQYCLQRYVQLTQARSPFPIKFNGMLYTANRPPNVDRRQWGGLSWWQNARLPYYNMAAAGDLDALRTLFDGFLNTLPVAEARTRAYHGFDGLFWTEYTPPLLGTTHPSSYGCGRAGGRPTNEPIWHSHDRWNGYNWQGSLDLTLMIIDYAAYVNYTGEDLMEYLRIPAGVVRFYGNLWGNTTDGGPGGGSMVFHPTQSLETWQCPGWPVDMTRCPTNDLPTVAGLRAVLRKLVRLPDRLASAEQKRGWAALLRRVPPLPTSADGAYVPCEGCCGKGLPGCHETSNFENAELYAVHPYRLATLARGDVGALDAAFEARRFKTDVGWNQNAMDAALLGDAGRAAGYVLRRAGTGPAEGYRFPAFLPREQDYEPSADHLAVMSNALQYMLVAPTDDESDGVMLLPAWPCEWDTTFRISAPRNTFIRGAVANGNLEFVVDPPERKADVVVSKCQSIPVDRDTHSFYNLPALSLDVEAVA